MSDSFVFDTNSLISAALIANSTNNKVLDKAIDLGVIALSNKIIDKLIEPALFINHFTAF
ncbi:MAG: hypothetical protein WKG06_44525 [Segetibacter sp.]